MERAGSLFNVGSSSDKDRPKVLYSDNLEKYNDGIQRLALTFDLT